MNKYGKVKRTTVYQSIELNESAKSTEDKVIQESYQIASLQTNNIFTFDNTESIILKGIKGHLNFKSATEIDFSNEEKFVEIILNDLSSKFRSKEYFYEKEISEEAKEYYSKIKSNGSYDSNVRVGIINSSCDTDISCGSELKSYGYRVTDGALINDGKILNQNDTLREGDVLCICYTIRPPKPKFMMEERENQELSRENSDKRIIEASYVKFYVNGIEQEYKFEGLYEGKYHLVISLYNYAEVELVLNKELFKYKYN